MVNDGAKHIADDGAHRNGKRLCGGTCLTFCRLNGGFEHILYVWKEGIQLRFGVIRGIRDR